MLNNELNFDKSLKVKLNFFQKMNLQKSNLIELINISSLDLNNKIPLNFATESFSELLSYYGLNTEICSKNNIKLKNKFLFIFFWFAFVKTAIIFLISPNNNYDVLIYLGDFTLLFKSLRKYFLIILLLFILSAIHISYLFNHNSIELFDLFKCLDGHITPKSIGIKNKNILLKILFATKVGYKLAKFTTNGFTFISFVFGLYLLFKNIYVQVFDIFYVLNIVSVVFWFLITIFATYFIGGIIFTTNICFELLCYYCFINMKFYNESVNLDKIKSFNRPRIVSKLMINYHFKRSNEFSIRILKYNKFWSEFYLSMIIHYLPSNIILLQQVLFGELNFQLRIIFTMCFIFGITFIVSTSWLVCSIEKEIQILTKKFIRIQLNQGLNLNINTKFKVY